MSFDLQVFANQVISQYVYGKNAAPTLLTAAEAESLIATRTAARNGNISINDTDFMSELR